MIFNHFWLEMESKYSIKNVINALIIPTPLHHTWHSIVASVLLLATTHLFYVIKIHFYSLSNL